MDQRGRVGLDDLSFQWIYIKFSFEMLIVFYMAIRATEWPNQLKAHSVRLWSDSKRLSTQADLKCRGALAFTKS